MSVSIKNLAAKSGRDNSALWLPYLMHARDTAGMMLKLFDGWLSDAARELLLYGLSEEELRRLCCFLGLIHDIGKLTLSFQCRIYPTIEGYRLRIAELGLDLPLKCPGNVTHAGAGEQILLSLGCPPGIASVVGAHHGRPQPKPEQGEAKLSKDYAAYYYRQKQEWKALWSEAYRWALDESSYKDAAGLPALTMKQQMVLTGLLIMADWLASNTGCFPLLSIDDEGSEGLYPGRINRGWAKLRLPGAWTPQFSGMDEEVFRERFGFGTRPLQKRVIELGSEAERLGLFIIEGQMGVGKTEAALALAEILSINQGCGGIFFGLPTQATANGIFPRLLRWAEKQAELVRLAIRLAHGRAELNEDYQELVHGSASIDDEEDGGLVVHSWFEGRKLALLGNFVIGTVDQLLMAVLKQKHVMLRHLGLAGKLVIIDEVHAYDAYMSCYLERALEWLGAYGVPVILLSATLPAARRTALVKAYLNKKALPDAPWKRSRAYPLLTWTDKGGVRQEALPPDGESREVELLQIGDGDRLSLLSEAMEAGGCAGVIVNTVKRAQELAKEIKAALPEAELILFHAQYLAPDRAELERELLRRLGRDGEQRSRLIVVGTQVLEQSLDIDFDVMLTDLCPMDLLLQRIGRLQRFRFFDALRPVRFRATRCYVVNAAEDELEGGAKAIYGEWLLRRTRRLLPERIRLPGSISELVQEVYDDESLDGEEQRLWEAYNQNQSDARNRADAYRLIAPMKDSARAYNSSINGLLDNQKVDLNDKQAQASVRDGDPSIEVVILMELEGEIRFLPWQNGGGRVLTDGVPSSEEQRQIARQRLRLPSIFCRGYNICRTIRELEAVTLSRFREWKFAPLLREESVLLLDADLRAELCGYRLEYSREYGLLYEKIE